ncbi:MAG: efflux RND transporter periplasmic adaptor subunit [Rhizomicrobium sp.]
MTVRVQQVRERFSAYGEVEPIAVSKVSAVEAGVIERLVLPGEKVKAGQELAIIGGIEAQSLLARERSALRAAAIRLSADRLKQNARLVTRQQVAMAEAAYQAARGQLKVARATLTLRAPVSGEVLAVDVSDGERVAAGQHLLTLQTGRLWLKAAYYGEDGLAIHPGMTGWFDPVSGAPIAVRVQTIARALSADGGEAVVLKPVLAHHQALGIAAFWRNGVWGKVRLDGAVQRMVAVPSRALILDRGRWWVMVLTPAGERRREVLPGPTRGWMTLIAQGLAPGTRILVQNAYLAFHQDIAQRYTPPD